jgi:hypothetical protein
MIFCSSFFMRYTPGLSGRFLIFASNVKVILNE